MNIFEVNNQVNNDNCEIITRKSQLDRIYELAQELSAVLQEKGYDDTVEDILEDIIDKLSRSLCE